MIQINSMIGAARVESLVTLLQYCDLANKLSCKF